MADVSFSMLLRRLRTEAGLTIAELARTSGVSVRGISDLERGRRAVPQRRTVEALADGLGLGEGQRALLLAGRNGGREPGAPGSEPGLRDFPRATEAFMGRETELARLVEAAASAAGQPVVVAVSGAPGAGKTAFVLHAVRQIADRFPAGQVLVDGRGLDEDAPESAELMVRVLKAFGVGDRELANTGADGHPALYQRVLSGQRCVLVLDNVRDEEQVRPLLPRAGTSMVILTSRRNLAGLGSGHRLVLGELSPDDAAGLLTTLIGRERAEAEPAAIAEIAERCGRLPLALWVAGNWLATRTAWSIRRLADRLAVEERRLDALAAGDVRVSAAFDVSYRQLGPAAAHMFRRLALIDGGATTASCAARLSGQALPAAQRSLDELVEAGLLTVQRGRYRLHDLLRLFAGDRLRAEETVRDIDSVRADLHHWLLDNAMAAGRWHEPGHRAPASHARPGMVQLSGADEAREWLQAEGTTWLAAYRAVAAAGEHPRVVEVAQSLHWFSYRWMFWSHWPEVFHTAAGAAEALEDPWLAAQFAYHAWALAAYEGRLPKTSAFRGGLARARHHYA